MRAPTFADELDAHAGVAGLYDLLAAVSGDPADVAAWYFDPAQIFGAWIITSRVFHHVEYTADGNALAVAVPLDRVARISATTTADRFDVTVEIDADTRSITLAGEAVDGPAVAADGTALDGQRYGRSNTEGLLRPAGYARSATEDPGRAALQRFWRTAIHVL